MGRQPNVPQQTSNGTFKCWHPGVKKYVNLGTQDYNAALAIQAGFYGRAPTQVVSGLGSVSPVLPRADSGVTVIDLDKPSEDGPTDASSLLTKWANRDAKPDPVPTPSPAVTPPGLSGLLGTPSLSFAAPTKPAPAGAKPKPGLTPEQSAKLASGLKKTVANLNVIIVGAGVQMFGRVPAPLDDEEVALLQMGWEMYIDEMFAKAKIKPWHLLLAGNVMIAAAMYVGGTPIVKKQLNPNDPTKAKSATITPINPTGDKPHV